MTGKGVHRITTVVLSLSMAAIGIVLLAQALSGGSGVVVRLLLGALFVAAGSGRLYLVHRRRGA